MRPWGIRSSSLVLVFALLGVDAPLSFAYQNGTHDHITGAAIQMVDANQYPDIANYAATIKSHSYGASAEGYAHGGPDAGWWDRLLAWVTYDGGPIGEWLLKIDAHSKNAADVTKVYQELGYLAHEIADQTSPTHAANIPHGPLDWFEFQTGTPSISGSVSPLDVSILSQVSRYYSQALKDTKEALPGYTDPAPPPGEPSTTYWTPNPNYNGDARQTPDGTYGGITVFYDQDGMRHRFEHQDTFSTTKSSAIAPTQASLAAGLVAGMLQSVSKLLPPLIENASLSPVNWPGSGPFTLTLHALENRVRTVRVTAEIFDSNGASVRKPLDLSPVSLDPGSRLPWEKDVSLDVDVSGLPEGTYKMKVTLRDADNNDSEPNVQTFKVDGADPTPDITDPNGHPVTLPGVEMVHDQCLMITGSDAGTGICSINLQGPSGFAGLSSPFPGLTSATLGPVCPGDLPDGCYTAAVTDCSGRASSRSFCIRGATTLMTLRTSRETKSISVDPRRLASARLEIRTEVLVGGSGNPGNPGLVCQQTLLSPPGTCSCEYAGGGGYCALRTRARLDPASIGFSVTNTTTVPTFYPVGIVATLFDASGDFAGINSALIQPPEIIAPGGSVSGSVEITAQSATIVTALPPPCLNGCIRPLSSSSGSPAVFKATVITSVLGMSNRLRTLPQQAGDAAAAQGLISPMFNDGFEIFFGSAVVSLVHPASIGMSFTSSLTPQPAACVMGSPAPCTYYGAEELRTLSIYRFNGTSWEQVSSPGQWSTIDGNRVVTISSVPISLTGLIAPLYRRLDNLPPVTTLSFGEPIAPDGRTISPATPLTLAATDDAQVMGDGLGWGVARTEYAVDAGPFQLYRGTFSISGEGTHSIRFFSVDQASHTETAKIMSVLVDATPPAPPTLLASGSNPSPWSNSGIFTLAVTTAADPSGTALVLGEACTAPTSNAAGVPLPSGQTTITPPCLNQGANPFYLWAMDGVGNNDYRNAARLDLRYDNIAPESYAQAPSTSAVGPILVHYNASDLGSGDVPPTGSGISKVLLWYRTGPPTSSRSRPKTSFSTSRRSAPPQAPRRSRWHEPLISPTASPRSSSFPSSPA